MNTTETTNPVETEPVVRVRGLAVIAMFVSDLERSVRFYRDMLGFTLGEQILEPGVTLEAGDAMIYLNGGRTSDDRPPLTHPEISLCLAMPGVQDACKRLREAGVRIVEDVHVGSEHFATCLLADPDGNLIQLWGRP